jgi:hypothetical protein
VASEIVFVYDYIIKICMTQAEVILNHVNRNVRGTGQGGARQRKYKRVKFGGSQFYDCAVSEHLNKLRYNLLH